MNERVVIGEDNLPADIREKLGGFLDSLDPDYEFVNGTTAMYWYLASVISNNLVREDG